MSASLTSTATELLATLVAFDTVSSKSNLKLIEWLENYLQPLGVECVRVPSPDGKKSNLLARIGPAAPAGIVLSGHTDVVPVEGQQWESKPFVLTERDGKLYGRGSCDMKGFLACALALVPHFASLALKKPIWLAFSYDEEVGCLGAPHLLAHMVKNIPLPAFALIGEPTMMRVVTAHKGVLSFETVVHGLEAHSSQTHLGINAVHVACDLVCFLKHLCDEMGAHGMRDARFTPPFSTVHVGVIEGGTARNIIPKHCRFLWEIRPLPADNADLLVARFKAHCEKLIAEMKLVNPAADIVTRPISRMTGVTLPARAESARQLVMHAAHSNQEHAVSFGTEAGVFNDNGIPAIICGPGNIEQAHKPNEFVDVAQIRQCVEFLLALTAQP